MAYNSNIPQGTDKISVSQSDILGNFQALAPFGNGYADFSLQGTVPTFSGTSNGMYTHLYAGTAKDELFIHKPSVDAPTDVPFTASAMSYVAMALCENGWSYLPSGLLVKWGTYYPANGAIALVPVNAISAGPLYNVVFQTYVTAGWSGAASDLASIPILTQSGVTTAGNFNVFVTHFNAFSSVNYLVIGV